MRVAVAYVLSSMLVAVTGWLIGAGTFIEGLGVGFGVCAAALLVVIVASWVSEAL